MYVCIMYAASSVPIATLEKVKEGFDDQFIYR